MQATVALVLGVWLALASVPGAAFVLCVGEDHLELEIPEAPCCDHVPGHGSGASAGSRCGACHDLALSSQGENTPDFPVIRFAPGAVQREPVIAGLPAAGEPAFPAPTPLESSSSSPPSALRC